MAKKCQKCQSDNPETAKFCSECATPLQHTKDIGVTKTLETPIEEYPRGSTFADRYKIIEKLGTGGMGAVYRVEDSNIGQDIALKLIKPVIASDKKTIERFRNELKITRMISHRNVCRMFDLAETEGTYYITMEYVPGEDLKSFIRRSGKLDIPKAISIAKEVCEGLSEAHRLGVVHRDLKSNNIMIDEEGNARIMDFGIARSIRAKGLTGEGVIIGTPEYMSPEQAETKEVDHRSDIYSLGVILYEMVTGHLPFEGDTPLIIALKHKSENPQNPTELNPQIPVHLSQLILKCLAKEKEERPQSASHFLAELSGIDAGISSTQKEIVKKKPLTSKEITVTFGLKKLYIPALALISVFVIGIFLWKILPKAATNPLASSGEPSLAIMYFQNNTGDESLDIWRDGLPRMLIADLSQSKYITVLADDRMYGILKELNLLETDKYSTKDLKEVAVQGRSTYILRGILTKSGDSFRINTTLQDSSTMEIVGSEMVEGMGEESFHAMVDELTRRIKENFELSEQEIAADIDRDVGRISASSPEAYKYYSEGIKQHNKGDYHSSLQFMEKAVALDPEFAMAYRSMGLSYDALKFRDRGRTYLQKALEFTDRLSDRDRLLIQGNLYQKSSRDFTRAIDTFNQLLELYPDDMNGNYSLASVYRSMELWDKAIELCERNFKNKDNNALTYKTLSDAYAAKGLYEKAQEHLEYYLSEIADSALIHLDLAIIHLCQDKKDLAAVELTKAEGSNPDYFQNFIDRGHVLVCEGNLDQAETSYRRILDVEDKAQHQWAFSWLASLYSLQGKYNKAVDQFERGLELSKELGETGSVSGFYTRLAYIYLFSGEPDKALMESLRAEQSSKEERGCLMCHQNWALLYKGLAQAKKKSLDAAQETAEELKSITEVGMGGNYMRLYHHLVGMIAFESGNYPEAIEEFSKAIDLLPYQFGADNLNDHALFQEARARAYYMNGDLEKAREDYENITALTVGRLHWGDIFAKSHYMLGKIYERKGWPGKAIEQYVKFLDLWKDADPGMAEIEDAMERLSGLKGENP